ncbi:MAG: hypothetical protein IPG88_12725 [Gemmatimonadetes bacterium]|nr:hypothetical protein [Gemmatimonadota bacterium]
MRSIVRTMTDGAFRITMPEPPAMPMVSVVTKAKAPATKSVKYSQVIGRVK